MIDPVSGAGLRPVGGVGVGSVGQPSATAQSGGEIDFASLIGEAVASLAQNLRNAETVSVAGIKGTAPIQDVVETVMSAEQSLQAAIAVRDKIVAAYLEISRMAI